MKKLLVALTACATLALAGCGDDGDKKDAADEPTALTKAQLIKKGDAICKAGSARIDKIPTTWADPENPTPQELEAAVEDSLLPELRDQLNGLRALEPPAADADEIDAMLDALEAGIQAAEADWEKALDDSVFTDANAGATAYGFKECGKE